MFILGFLVGCTSALAFVLVLSAINLAIKNAYECKYKFLKHEEEIKKKNVIKNMKQKY